MNRQEPAIFDGHNDLLGRIHTGAVTEQQVLEGYRGGHIDLPRARAGGFGGGLFAVFVPSPQSDLGRDMAGHEGGYDVPLPPALSESEALTSALAQIASFRRLAALGAITPCTTAGEIRTALAGDNMAAVLHMEGAEAIDPDFNALEVFHAAGLRSLGPVWSRPTRFGHGVPFRFPSTGDIGPGLTDAGRQLVRECNRLGIMLDLSHLNEAGFNDVAALSDAPLVASHSNAHAICPHARNLTDRQLDMMAERDGLVGINFATAFLRPDGRMQGDCALDVLLRHLDHLLERLGEHGVGFGSDFDGAVVPRAIGDCSGLPRLRDALRQHGLDKALITRLCHDNWLRVLERTWGE
ncbi:dipeptidase [Kushneria phosphatilytica]|uniref:Membrane dipeptidase n=1 Tax=Kushneria phosphatilytica TaxID=657387 RepID=A0A1S1NSR9_9GAMM|nr:dipeptidase [Kushneria phosphatilytica]OHV08384.1 peptidase M19 [Kushneria phosphatilytica]QEL09806.1 membrane dipeptidase [Kushneria phosphatilytica]